MNYRSISSHRGMPDPQVIDLAARLGYNDVCFQIEGEQSRMLRELRERWDRSGTPAHIKSLDMTISLWVHEFEDLDPEWGEPVLENERLWAELRARYVRLLTEELPEVDWLVLTVVESTVRVTDPRMLETLCLLLREVCAECGRKLMIRSFVWTLKEFAGVQEAIAKLPDDISVMTKYVPQDWHRGSYDDGAPFHDPLIGKVGNKQQFVELDIAGEYFRGDQIAHCFAEELHKRFAFWKEQGVDGISVRIDRGWRAYHHHDCILHEVQESNLWCLGQWMTGVAEDIDIPLVAWATERFGSEVAEEMAAIARLCDNVTRESLTVCNEPFGDTRRPQPAYRSLVPPKEAPATLTHPAKAENHIDPFCRWLALWRWDPSLTDRYEKLRTGDPAMSQQKEDDLNKALSDADEALSRLKAIQEKMTPGAYEFIRFRLEENRHHLLLMSYGALAWLACLRRDMETMETHLQQMMQEWEAHRHEAATVVWPEGRTRYLQRCIKLEVPQFCAELRRHAEV